ncbi:MAG: carbohydrate porin [Phycisphaerae bacterium]
MSTRTHAAGYRPPARCRIGVAMAVSLSSAAGIFGINNCVCADAPDSPVTASVTTPSAPVAPSAPEPGAGGAGRAPSYSGDLTGDWFGLRPRMQQSGITFGASLLVDGTSDLSGGMETHEAAFRTQLTLDVNFDLDKLVRLPGGTVYASYMGLWGHSGTTAPVGSLQLYDSIINPRTSTLDELYYGQKVGSLLQFRIGRQDESDFFAQPPDAQPFINDSATEFPTLIDPPTFPDTAPGVVAVAGLNSPLTFKLGAYYFARFHPSALDQALNTLEPTDIPPGTFLIAEGDYSWQLGGNHPGVAAVGGSWSDSKLPTLGGAVQSGGVSVYSYIDQTLWSDTANQSITAFGTLMAADKRVSTIDFASQAGVVGTGLIPTRPNDQIGLGYDWAHISSEANLPKPYELAIEGFYAVNLGHGIDVQPDLQYYVNTGGGVYPDALVATIRLSVAF